MEKVLPKSRGRLAFYVVGLVWLTYALLTIFGPRVNNYDVSPTVFVLVQFSVVMPVLAIWLTAAYGAIRFKSYSRMIASSPDGRALNLVTTGLILLIVALISQTLLGVFPRYAVGQPWQPALVFIRNHVPLIISILSLAYITLGSYSLVKLVKGNTTYRRNLALVLAVYAAAAAWMAQFFYTNLSHTVSGGVPNFATPGHWPFYTMAIPYLLVWGLGVISVLNIATYISNVKGAIYRSALRYLASGLMTVITFAMALQMLAFANSAVLKLSFGAIVALVYLILIVYALGFVLLAMGARRLVKIEAS